MGRYACDLESTGLLEDFPMQESPKIHCFGIIDLDGDGEWCLSGEDMQEHLQSFLSRGHTLVMHNGVCYDGEVLKYFGYDLGDTRIIDTLLISHYLYPERKRHGLDLWGEELGVKKPVVTDWEGLTQDEYNYRVMQDCRIQKLLWQHQKSYLSLIYSGEDVYTLKVVDALMWKAEQQRIQQSTKWKLDIAKAESLLCLLEQERDQKIEALALEMPKRKVLKKKQRPSKPYKSDGTLSSTGVAWEDLCATNGIPFDYDGTVEVVVGETDPNPASPTQVKDWLYSLGWQPTTFKYVKEADGEPKKIPQVNVAGGEVCESVALLADKDPAILHLKGLGILKHRSGLVSGFLRDQKNGCLTARSGGLTNTLRCQHREVVNLPSSRVPYGEDIRGCLVARDGYVLLGSDLSSLENRLGHHFMMKFDPDYVSTMLEADYDPHLQVAMTAGLLTKDDISFYKDVDSGRLLEYDAGRMKTLKGIRSAGKTVNYASVYGAGAATIARAAGVSLKLAKTLHQGYWDLNWSVKKVASLTEVKTVQGQMWQYNPISGLWYSLRADKDRFSTLIQGSGAYAFDRWLWWTQKLCKEAGVAYRLIATFHDEMVVEVDKTMTETYQKLVDQALVCTNTELSLRRDLGCTIQFGDRYSEIH